MPVWNTKHLAQSIAQNKLSVVVHACDPRKHGQEDGMFKAIFNCTVSSRPLNYTRHCLQEKRRKGRNKKRRGEGKKGEGDPRSLRQGDGM